MNSFEDLTIKSFGEGLRNGEFSALETTQTFFNSIEKKNPEIHAYLALNEDEAMRQAQEVDLKISKKEDVGPLAGVPLAIKDCILVKGLKATSSSKILEDYTASYDAFVIQKLKENNSVLLGKTNLDEFAMGVSTENSAFGPTKNPHDTERVAGGSSGGSAAAVAANMALAALGSDTGGSIRQPAAFCGVVGLKTTYGSVSRSGLIALASSLDQIGPITKTVEDAAILFSAIRGKDPMDSTSVEMKNEENLLNPDFAKIKNLRVGIPKEYFEGGLAKDVEEGVNAAIEKIKSLGLKFEEVSLPHTKYGVSTYYIILPAEASANLARFDGIRYGERHESKDLKELYLKTKGHGFGPETKRRIILGTFVLSSGYYDAYYEKAQRVRAMIKNDFDQAFKSVDVMLTPVSPTSAWKIGEKSDPLAMYLADIFTIPANLAGIPGISIPVKTGSKMPVAFQLLGREFKEADILGLGQYFEKLDTTE